MELDRLPTHSYLEFHYKLVLIFLMCVLSDIIIIKLKLLILTTSVHLIKMTIHIYFLNKLNYMKFPSQPTCVTYCAGTTA